MSRTFILMFFVAVLGTGCGESLKSGWNDFRAYYNTFYNAKGYFEEGQKAVRDQQRSLSPDSPVRVHPTPVPAGRASFEQAIEKGNQILRRHTESEWVDDALLLMGKSSYYLQDYAGAIKRFEQLQNLNPSPSIQRQAMIWKGRSLLDLGVYSQGVVYIEELLQDYPSEWPAGEKGELQILAGEHHAMLENREQASQFLSAALSNISDRKLRGPAFFLYGQLLEWQDRLEEAYYAYSQVSAHFAGFEYDYWSQYKQAEVARKQGNLEIAFAIYQRLQNDDKYMDRQEQLTFEIARILEEQGRASEAEDHYRRLLYGEQRSESRSLQSEIHYRLGKIQSERYQNYTAAAAYFDTSASLGGQPEENPSDEEAPALAEAYGQYTDIKQSIHRTDSLLWLGSLSPEKLDSLLDQRRATKRQQLLEQQEEDPENRLMNQAAFSEEADTTNRSGIYGFLNHRSQNLTDQGQAEFRIIWGDRPLTDNWRRREAAGQREDDIAGNLPEEESANGKEETEILNLNTGAIPQTEAERIELKADRTAYQYQLGNVFFLKLDQPDSARVYYHKVMNGEHNPALRPRAIYALYEVFRTTNHADSLRYWADRLIADYPDSKYAQLVDRKKGDPADAERDSTQKLRDQFHAIEASSDSSGAVSLRSLALSHRSSELAPHIHYRAIEAYIREARLYQWIADIMSVSLVNTNTDSVFFQPDLERALPEESTYTVAHWDRVRTLLEEHEAIFDGSPYQKDVDRLRGALEDAVSELP